MSAKPVARAAWTLGAVVLLLTAAMVRADMLGQASRIGSMDAPTILALGALALVAAVIVLARYNVAISEKRHSELKESFEAQRLVALQQNQALIEIVKANSAVIQETRDAMRDMIAEARNCRARGHA